MLEREEKELHFVFSIEYFGNTHLIFRWVYTAYYFGLTPDLLLAEREP
jgi:hypothetical protein